MANRFAAAAADAVADALKKASSSARLEVVQRFVDGLKANNIVALNREKKDLFAISIGGIIKSDLALLPGGFWERLAMSNKAMPPKVISPASPIRMKTG